MEHFLQINEFSVLLSQIFIVQINSIVPRGTMKNPGMAGVDNHSMLLCFYQVSMLARLAFSWMNSLRGSTWSPMRSVKVSSAACASVRVTRRSFLVRGFIVVSQSCSELISPRPLNRWMRGFSQWCSSLICSISFSSYA